MCVFHTLWHPCLSELASQGGSLGWQPRLWPHSSWWLSGQCALGSTRLGFQSQHSPSNCVALDLSLSSEPLCPQG